MIKLPLTGSSFDQLSLIEQVPSHLDKLDQLIKRLAPYAKYKFFNHLCQRSENLSIKFIYAAVFSYPDLMERNLKAFIEEDLKILAFNLDNLVNDSEIFFKEAERSFHYFIMRHRNYISDTTKMSVEDYLKKQYFENKPKPWCLRYSRSKKCFVVSVLQPTRVVTHEPLKLKPEIPRLEDRLLELGLESIILPRSTTPRETTKVKTPFNDSVEVHPRFTTKSCRNEIESELLEPGSWSLYYVEARCFYALAIKSQEAPHHIRHIAIESSYELPTLIDVLNKYEAR